MARHISVIVVLAISAFLFFSFIMSFGRGSDNIAQTFTAAEQGSERAKGTDFNIQDLGLSSDLLQGQVITPKLENATARAELGRATWKFLHTMAARFPENPTPDESEAASSFMYLFSRLYPCGDCARHFQMFLEKYPPQVSSRNALAGWLCMAHNKANQALKKPQFDCSKIGDFYDCGCGEDDKDKKTDSGELKEKAA